MEKTKYAGFVVLFLTAFYGLCLFFFKIDTTYILDQNNLSDIIFKRADNQAVKRIVLWTSWFGQKNWKHFMGNKDEIEIDCSALCTVHTDRGNPLHYDAFVFHGRDSQNPPNQRKPNQVYIIYLLESPYHNGPYIKGDKFYNWTATYSSKSDVQVPYWLFKRKEHEGNLTELALDLPQMRYNRSSSEALVSWVVSNCNTPGKREVYVNRLKLHTKVDIYGGCGKICYQNKRLSGSACHEALAKSGKYKFYLSFENSACRDYITEKTRNPLTAGLVPIVYGGLSTQEYMKKLPPNSFINVRNFRSLKQLANYLSYLDKNDTAYMAYHAWRLDYELVSPDHLCRICKALHNGSLTKPRNVDFEQFWNIQKECDSNLIDKVIKDRVRRSTPDSQWVHLNGNISLAI